MTATNLLYLNDFNTLQHDAYIVDIVKENEKEIVILNQTIFYPQGGGQPYDKGRIESPNAQFKVEEVRMINNLVKHIGEFERGYFNHEEKVIAIIDKERRLLNSKLHSAGHVVDMVVQQLKLNWIPGKGYHFPNGPYVEYSGSFDGLDKEMLISNLEKLCNQFIQESRITSIKFIAKENVKSFCNFIPDHISSNQPIRLIIFGDNFAIPCGGTHVANIAELKQMSIRKIKMEKGHIRVGYEVMS